MPRLPFIPSATTPAPIGSPAFTAGAWAWLPLSVMWLALQGCATPGPDAAQSPRLTPQAMGLAQGTTTEVEANWWQQFGSPELDRLVSTALQGHPGVAVARARFAQAEALAQTRQASAQVQAGVGVDASRQLYSSNGLVPPPVAGHTYNSGTVQTGLSWSPDWFGQQAAEQAAALDQVHAAQADTAVASTALATQVVRAYVALARLTDQHAVLTHMATTRQAMLALTHRRVAAGLDTGVELAQAQGPVADAAQQAEAVTEQMDLLRHQLSVLSGQPAAALQGLRPTLAGLQLATQPLDLGADLLGRRPDVVAARWRVEAAVADVQLAKSQFYPNISLTALVGVNALGLDRLFRASSLQAGVAPALRLPLFDGGLLRARLGGKQAGVDAAVAQYNATVLDAVREAADALTTVHSVQRQAQQQAQALAHAERAQALAAQRHQAGLTGSLPELAARLQVLAQQRQTLELAARALDGQALAMKALGGGWRDAAPTMPAATPDATPTATPAPTAQPPAAHAV